MTVGYTLSAAATSSDQVVVTLAGFAGQNRNVGEVTASMLTDPGAGYFSAASSSWGFATKRLELVVGGAAIPGGEAVLVTVLSACGLKLPSTSLGAAHASLQIGFSDQETVDNVAAATVSQSPAVSAELTATSLSY